MMNTQEFTTMEQLSMMDSVTNGAVLQYGPLVLVTDNAYREEFTAQIYEFVETPEEAGVGLKNAAYTSAKRQSRNSRTAAGRWNGA